MSDIFPPSDEVLTVINTGRPRNVETENHPTFTADYAYLIYEFCLVNPTELRPFCGIVEQNITNPNATPAIGNEVKADITEGIEVDVPSEMIAAGSNFTVKHADVFWNNATHQFHDTADDGLFLVGNVQVVQNVDGMFKFLKRRYAIRQEGT